VEAATGRVLFEKDADARQFPASATKLMTAALALESLPLSRTVTVSQTAVNIDRDGSAMGLLAGEELTVEQLAYGLLVHSANDAANALAEETAGSIEAFVEMMNAKARELGMNGTRFVNPHGYHDDEHYTTARDLAALAGYARKNAELMKIAGTAAFEMEPTNKYREKRIFSNTNALLNKAMGAKYFYEAATGLKTGHTSKAGHCLVASAKKGQMEYVAVVLDSVIEDGENFSFTDTKALFEYGFNGFQLKTLLSPDTAVSTVPVRWSAGRQDAVLTAAAPFQAVLPKDFAEEKLEKRITVREQLTAPLAKGDVVGNVEFICEGVSLGRVNLLSAKEVKRGFFNMIFTVLFEFLWNIWTALLAAAALTVWLICRAVRGAVRRGRTVRRCGAGLLHPRGHAAHCAGHGGRGRGY
jgi:D-alanyl-D-alanine carboxypeptidase